MGTVLIIGGTKMTRQMSEGKCALCSNTFSKGTMAKHLKSCIQKNAIMVQSGSHGSQKAEIIHLVVEGRDLPEYWMHFEAPANMRLKGLDAFLRRTWLECCGHLSAFTIEGRRYMSDPDEDFGDEGMDATLGDLLSVGTKFYHEYDFGTTTELTLKAVSRRRGRTRGKSIWLLARNNPPQIKCGLCGETATKVCSQCDYSDRSWLCDKCAGEHECGEEMLLPVANSPRVGMCGYTG